MAYPQDQPCNRATHRPRPTARTWGEPRSYRGVHFATLCCHVVQFGNWFGRSGGQARWTAAVAMVYSGYVFQPARMSTTLAGQIGKIYVTLIVRICHRLDGLYESMEWRNGHMILSAEGIIEQDDERHNEANQSSKQRHHSQMHP